ncbi:hypothetical protein AMTRI_Chr03g44380 [Amborella trichopoda]
MGEKGEVKLIGAWPSPFVLRARVALNLKSVDYEFLQETLGNKSELLLRSNPVYKKVPVLLHHDQPICESLIIVQYIDEVWPGPAILPKDPSERALARFWAAYVDDKVFPAMQGMMKAQGQEEEKSVIDQLLGGLQLLEGALREVGKGKRFFGGDEIGYIDIALGSMLGWMRVTERFSELKLFDAEKTPLLVQWADSFTSAEAVNGVMPETDKLVEFAKILLARFKSQA